MGSRLTSVSCPWTTTVCTTVGSFDDPSGTDETLAERSNGTSWSIQTTPNPAGASGSQLNAVTCTSSTVCEAVGAVGAAYGTLAERWSAGSWQIEPTPNPTGAPSDELTAVTCTSSTTCLAVGDYGHDGIVLPLAEQYR
jgi:hypothetical protein